MTYDERYSEYAQRHDAENQRRLLNQYLLKQAGRIEFAIDSVCGWPNGQIALQESIAEFTCQLSSWPCEDSHFYFFEDEATSLISKIETSLTLYHQSLYKTREFSNKHQARVALEAVLTILNAELNRIQSFPLGEL